MEVDLVSAACIPRLTAPFHLSVMAVVCVATGENPADFHQEKAQKK